jgi:hypothetical protein
MSPQFESLYNNKEVELQITIHLTIIIPGDQEGLFKLAIQLRKFLFITL